MQFFRNETTRIAAVAPLILGASLIIAAIIGSVAFYNSRATDDYISVTGSTKRQITSDTVRWVSSFSRTVTASSLNSGYTQMARDLVEVKAFFTAQGIDPATLVISPVAVEQIYNYNNQNVQTETQYTLRQTVEVNSKDVAKLTEVSKNVQSLVSKGVFFASQSLEYSYSGIADLRVELLGDAVKDATARAKMLAESSGGKLGGLKAAASGVVQVLPVNSVDVSDYGSYDTSHIEKEVMVTVKASFNLR